MNLRSDFGVLPLRTLNLLLAITVLGAVGAYIFIAHSFFPDPLGRLGDDYEYFMPLLLAGKYWIAQNGVFAVPRFSPAFCGGLPFLANPQSIFYSVPQALSLFLSPAASLFYTTIAFAGAGAIGTYALMRRRFAVSVPASALSAVIFLFNGFLLHRMAIGHVTYHAFGLTPLLCYVLLRPCKSGTSRRQAALDAIGATAIAGAILAYFVFAGAANIVVPLGLTCIAVWLIHALVRTPVASFWTVGAAASAIGAVAAAAKLAPAAIFILHFPRPHDIALIGNPVSLLHAILPGFFLPFLLPDHLWGLGKHEFEFGVGLVPPLLILAAYDRNRLVRLIRHGRTVSLVKLAALLLLLALPIALNSGGPGYAVWLKKLPYINENVVLIRWFFIDLMPLILGAGLALDSVIKSPERRASAAIIGMLVTILPSLIVDRPVYDQLAYDAASVMAAADLLRQGASPPAISRIADGNFGTRNDGLVTGQTNFPCYEPLFGYQLETFPPGLTAGPILSGAPGGVHLRNPACYIYGSENGCAPGDSFTDAQAADESAFASYRPFTYVMPSWQKAADLISLLGLMTILLGLAIDIALHVRRAVPARGHPPADGLALRRDL